jgi:signal transduction histidine kinase
MKVVILCSKIFIILIFVFLVETVSVFAASRDDAVAMVNNAVTLMNVNGKIKAVTEFNKKPGPFQQGDLYIFVINTNGDVLAHSNPGLIRKNVINLKDPDGTYFIQKIIKETTSKKKCWVAYKWSNPVTKKIEPKYSYCILVGDTIISAGVYNK